MFDVLMADIERDLDQLREPGRMSRAVQLTEVTGVHFNTATYPLYFTGDLNAKVVLVHLNPKQKNEPSGARFSEPEVDEVSSFVARHAKFGEREYGPKSDRTHRSPFDERQVRFLRPFQVIDFADQGDTEDHRYLNLQRVVDDKLQLEFIPYGSNTFSSGKLAKHPELLEPHFNRLIDTISAVERDYVIFCGTAFDPLLKKYRAAGTEWFNLEKNDRQPEVNRSRCTRLTIPTDNGEFKAMLAHSYPRQGIPMRAYGEAVARRYGEWKDQA